jgi:hypothetical protein
MTQSKVSVIALAFMPRLKKRVDQQRAEPALAYASVNTSDSKSEALLHAKARA